MRNRLWFLAGLVILLGAGCANYSAPSAPVPAAPTAQTPVAPAPAPAPVPAAPVPIAAPQVPTQADVSISGFSFQPASLTVKSGTTVIWTNQDSVTHTVTAADGSFTGTVSPGMTFSRIFTQAGTYAYHCSIHPSMQGTIIVQ